ncbi:MAG: NAD(P)/FAD-dependent oxidoreductase [Campylobacterota bacterium]|nr:NAD(P)/FAD-dependent oxidoreductase [Campylobacterota bacterium]
MIDVVVIGAGAAGIMATISAQKRGHSVLLIEKLSSIGAKLKATGGGRCNLTNTLDNETFMERFGRNGRFMQEALKAFDHHDLTHFFHTIGVETHSPDGFRIFPTTHSASTIINALQKELEHLAIKVITNQEVIALTKNTTFTITTTQNTFEAHNVIIATGGLGYPMLGATGDGHTLAASLGHKLTSLFPAMLPLHTKEDWVANCRADTIPKATLKVNMKKHAKLQATGDLIFTNKGIRGPVVLDFAREVTPLIEKYGEVPIVLNLTKGMNEEQIRNHLQANRQNTILDTLSTLLPQPLSIELLHLAQINPDDSYKIVEGSKRDKLIKTLTWTPLTVIGSDGFNKAMITRGGISLKEINPYTMQSKKLEGLYFCGEVMDIDGPCGGYNLQWSFSSGYLAGQLST